MKSSCPKVLSHHDLQQALNHELDGIDGNWSDSEYDEEEQYYSEDY
jgi:hypothetical protein